MAIRVFLNTWTERPDGSGIEIVDPIDEYLANITLSAPVVGMNFYARMSMANRPDRQYLIKVMRGNLTAAEWDSLDALPGVRMLPAAAFDRQLSTIGTAVRNRIYGVLDELGIPRTAYTSATTIGGFLRNVLTELDGDQQSFGSLELLPSEWA